MNTHLKFLGLALLLAFSTFAQVDTSSIQMFETLDEVEIDRDPGVRLSKKSVLSKELISEVELRKAACCDLSESFETNASISASFTDAVTGTRQIRLLGLEGPYALYTRGNLQTMGGLSSVLGLALIPGAWIQSIQLTKGPGSVVNGAAAMSGQINYELRPSFTKEKAHFNLFARPGRFEQNAIYTWKQSAKWSSNVMVHGRQQLFRWDGNEDGYLDAPLSNHVFIQNAWKHQGDNSEAQFGIKASGIKNIGGSTLYGTPTLVPIWSHELETNRYELWAKRGYFLNGGINRSIGTQFSATYQDLDSYFGNRIFTGKERRLYGNLIFQDNILDTRHTLKGGLDANSFSISQEMWENDGSYDGLCTGVYGEYSYVNSPDGEGFSMILGQRIDVLRHYLPFYVPRLHLKYNSGPWAFRGQASRSWRIATLGAEYMGYMANDRTAVFLGNQSDQITPPIETSNTYGIGVNWSKDVLFKEMQWYADVFYTQFANKVVFDFDGSTDTLLIGSPGGSYSNVQERILYSPYSISAQVGGQYELFHRTMIKVSYRYQDVKQRDLTAYYASGANEDYYKLEEVILNVPHLIYMGASYSGRKGMGIELNATYNSSQRLPLVGYAKRSYAFTMLNGQISKEDRAFGQFYIGIQNALNVRQLDPIVGGNLPFDGGFDASIVWGPIMGRQIYAGWRYDLKFQD
ncbi:MAG: hypothetical protein ISP75_03285 [Cryomorphaceae bacterium]|nr:hypothetical protein [Cryomorphaceae bacterium]MBL6866933.1 hypothetical protein [Cryomorphaceae bacterium]